MTLLPCPFCGGPASVGQQFDAFADGGTGYFVNCADCLVSTNILAKGAMPETESEAAELWNRRVTIDEAEYWAGVIEQVVVNGLKGRNEFARIMAKPGISFTAEQNAAIKAAVEAGNIAEAQRMILDVLNEAIGEDWLRGRGDAKPIGLLFGLPIVEVDDLGDASQIVLGPPLI